MMLAVFYINQPWTFLTHCGGTTHTGDAIEVPIDWLTTSSAPSSKGCQLLDPLQDLLHFALGPLSALLKSNLSYMDS